MVAGKKGTIGLSIQTIVGVIIILLVIVVVLITFYGGEGGFFNKLANVANGFVDLIN